MAADDDDDERGVEDLRDALKQKDRRIAEMWDEIDEQRDLIERLREHVDDWHQAFETLKEAFGMVLDDNGMWTWKESFVDGGEWAIKYSTIVRDWNKNVAEFNAVIRPRNVGRPLAASEAQIAQVRKLRKAGSSLRGIVDETGLTLATVRTIAGSDTGTDRTSIKHLSRIDPERARVKVWLAKKRLRDGLPKRLHDLRKRGDKLIKEAKGGLGR
jgi:hypothetical protein